MRKTIMLFLGLMLLTVFNSCSKDKQLDEQLVGLWSVSKVEGQQIVNGINGIYLVDNNPSGTIQFDDDGKGLQNYSFTLLGTSYPQYAAFQWSSTDDEIKIKRVNEPDMVWERLVTDYYRQVATYNIVVDANTSIQYTLTLDK